MKDWFLGLDTREQRFVLAGAAVVLIAVFYGAIWSPLDRGHRAAQEDVSTWSRSLSELKALRPRLAGTSPNAASGSQAIRSPIVVVDESLQNRGLNVYRTRSQPVSTNGIRVDFENVAFDDLVLWLGDVSTRYDLHVQQGSFSGGNRNAEGRVNAQLTLERAP